jgi:hypothetical protein
MSLWLTHPLEAMCQIVIYFSISAVLMLIKKTSGIFFSTRNNKKGCEEVNSGSRGGCRWSCLKHNVRITYWKIKSILQLYWNSFNVYIRAWLTYTLLDDCVVANFICLYFYLRNIVWLILHKKSCNTESHLNIFLNVWHL